MSKMFYPALGASVYRLQEAVNSQVAEQSLFDLSAILHDYRLRRKDRFLYDQLNSLFALPIQKWKPELECILFSVLDRAGNNQYIRGGHI